MEVKFVWREPPPSVDDRTAVESRITDFLNNSHRTVTPCHSGITVVSLASPDPFTTALSGEIACPCGRLIGVLGGNIDSQRIEVKSVSA